MKNGDEQMTYSKCASVINYMWINNVLTDMEYDKIMIKLQTTFKEKTNDENRTPGDLLEGKTLSDSRTR